MSAFEKDLPRDSVGSTVNHVHLAAFHSRSDPSKDKPLLLGSVLRVI